jgi:hypothetical protein
VCVQAERRESIAHLLSLVCTSSPLLQWFVKGHPTAGDSPKYDWSDAGESPWRWNAALLGRQTEWQDAGMGALALGAIGVIFAGLAVIFILVSLVRREFTKVVGTLCAFLSGVSILLGACIYEGMRPQWGGEIGYAHPMGLYLGAGICAEVAAIIAWSADYVPEGKAVLVDDNRM